MLTIVDDEFISEVEVEGTPTLEQLQACIEVCDMEGVTDGQFVLLYEDPTKGHVMSNYEDLEKIIAVLELAKARVILGCLEHE